MSKARYAAASIVRKRCASTLPGAAAGSSSTALPGPSLVRANARFTAYQLFRLAVFGSTFVTFGSLALWASTNAYIEHVELGRSLPLHPEDEFDLSEDSDLAWSGAHLGGGTDPRLSFLARNAIRAAYIAQHYGNGPLIAETAAANGMIGSQGIQVKDAGYTSAESYLLYAITAARQRGITIPDRAAVELESRLAGLRERMGGKTGLENARVSWERIWFALQSVAISGDAWSVRESARVARKVGDICLRQASESRQSLGAVSSATQDLQDAEKWLLQSAKTTLRLPDHITAEPTKQGWFASGSPHELQPLESIQMALEGNVASYLSPVERRSLSVTLSSLAALYAQRSLPTATALLESALVHSPASPKLATTLPEKLHHSFLAARHALLQVFASEIRLASTELDARPLLFAASVTSRDASKELQSTGLNTERSMWKAIQTAFAGSSSARTAERLRSRILSTDRDARAAASSSYYLLGVVHERAGRLQEAAEAYSTAMKLSAGVKAVEDISQQLDKHADEMGFRKAFNAHVRLKDKL